MDRTKRALLLAAFVLRVLAGFASGHTVGGDAGEYLRLAHNLAYGHGFSLSPHAPYLATDWRMPSYPLVLLPAVWLHLGHAGDVFTNALLAIIGLVGLFRITDVMFAGRPRTGLWVNVLLVLFPTAVTYAGMVLTENIYLAAGPWLVYLLFFSPRGFELRAGWLAGLFISASALSLDRAEGALFVGVAFVVAWLMRRPPLTVALCALCLVAVAPVAWAIRNDAALGRLELSDPLYRDQQFLLTFTNGSQGTPLFLEAAKLGAFGRTHAAARARYPHEVWQVVTHTPLSTAGKFDVKALGNLPFVPPVWGWAIESFTNDYTLGDSIRHPSARNAVRLLWSGCLLVLYLLALVGVVHWWRTRRRTYVLAIVTYPCIEVLISIPLQADPRQWLFASVLAVFPAAEGASLLAARRRRSANTV